VVRKSVLSKQIQGQPRPLDEPEPQGRKTVRAFPRRGIFSHKSHYNFSLNKYKAKH
jgi:hypothetical protein